jgi:hypothetical protein
MATSGASTQARHGIVIDMFHEQLGEQRTDFLQAAPTQTTFEQFTAK